MGFARHALHRLLQLVEGAHLDLAHPFATDAVDRAQLFKGRRIFLQAALGEDVLLALVQGLQRFVEQTSSAFRIRRRGQAALRD